MESVEIAKLSLQAGDTIIAQVKARPGEDDDDMCRRIREVRESLEIAAENAGLGGRVKVLVGDGSVAMSILRKDAA